MHIKVILTLLIILGNIPLLQCQSKDILAKSAMLNAESSYENGNYRECIDFLKEVEINLGKTNSRIQYVKVKSLIALGTQNGYDKDFLVKADQELKEFFKVTPENSYVPEKYDEMVLAVSKMKKMISEATKVEARKLMFSGYVKLENFDLNGALIDFNNALELDPSNDTIYFFRGKTNANLLSPDHLEAAIADFTEAIRINSNRAIFYYQRGEAKSMKGDHDGAIIDYNKAIMIDPSYADAYFSRGGVKVSKSDFLGAISDFSKAISYDSQNPYPYFSRGFVKYQIADYSGALEDFNKTIEISPTGYGADEYYFYRGKTNQKLKNINSAFKDFTKVIELGYDTIEMAFSYYYIGKKQQAFSILNQLIKTTENSHFETTEMSDYIYYTNYYALAGLYSIDKNKTESLKALRIALQHSGGGESALKDEDFINLREDADFKNLVNEFKNKP